MKKSPGIWIALAAGCALAALLLLLFTWNRNRRAEVTCTGVKVEFADDHRFVSEAEIEEYLTKDYGTYIGKRLDSLDLSRIETMLAGKSAILRTEAFTTPDGLLNIRLYQREPVVRFQRGAEGFYADARGYLFPLSAGCSSPVPVVDGAVPISVPAGFKGEAPDEKEREWIRRVTVLAQKMARDPWKGFFSQVTVEPDGDLVLIPREGQERFILGGPDRLDAKFRRIQEYYTAIVPARGKDFYRTVDVKFEKQIVCRK